MLQTLLKSLGQASSQPAPANPNPVPKPDPNPTSQPIDYDRLVAIWSGRLQDYAKPLCREEVDTILPLCEGRDPRIQLKDADRIKFQTYVLAHFFLYTPNLAWRWGNQIGWTVPNLQNLQNQISVQLRQPSTNNPATNTPIPESSPTSQPEYSSTQPTLIQPSTQPTNTQLQPQSPPPSNPLQGQMVKRSEEPRQVEPHAQKVEERPVYRDEYERKGEEMAIAFNELNYSGVEFMESSNDGPRHTRFIFRKPTSLPFNRLQQNIDDVLSHAGYSPEDASCLFRKLAGNRFEFQIARPREEWNSYSLLPSDFFNSVSTAKKLLKDLTHKLNSVDPASRREGLFLRFGVDMDGRSVELDCTTGAILVGEPNSGKSTAIKALVAAFCLTHTPDQGKIVRLDFKDGLTLSLLDGLPHLWHLPGEIRPCPTISSIADAEEVISYLEQEFTRRTDILKRAKLENIYQFNKEYPQDRIPVILTILEEVAGYYAQAVAQGKAAAERSLQRLFYAVSQFRAAGMPMVFTTQYPADRCGMPAEVRSCLGAGVCFKTSKRAADLVFGDGDTLYSRQVMQLTGMGDAIVKQHGSHIHCQGYDLPTNQLKVFVQAMGQLHGSITDNLLMDDIQGLIG